MLPKALLATPYILVIFYYHPWRYIDSRGKGDFFTLRPAPLYFVQKKSQSTIDYPKTFVNVSVEVYLAKFSSKFLQCCVVDF